MVDGGRKRLLGGYHRCTFLTWMTRGMWKCTILCNMPWSVLYYFCACSINRLLLLPFHNQYELQLFLLKSFFYILVSPFINLTKRLRYGLTCLPILTTLGHYWVTLSEKTWILVKEHKTPIVSEQGAGTDGVARDREGLPQQHDDSSSTWSVTMESWVQFCAYLLEITYEGKCVLYLLTQPVEKTMLLFPCLEGRGKFFFLLSPPSSSLLPSPSFPSWKVSSTCGIVQTMWNVHWWRCYNMRLWSTD